MLQNTFWSYPCGVSLIALYSLGFAKQKFETTQMGLEARQLLRLFALPRIWIQWPWRYFHLKLYNKLFLCKQPCQMVEWRKNPNFREPSCPGPQVAEVTSSFSPRRIYCTLSPWKLQIIYYLKWFFKCTFNAIWKGDAQINCTVLPFNTFKKSERFSWGAAIAIPFKPRSVKIVKCYKSCQEGHVPNKIVINEPLPSYGRNASKKFSHWDVIKMFLLVSVSIQCIVKGSYIRTIKVVGKSLDWALY